MLCNLLFALGWGSAQPAFWAIVSKVDATGRIFVAAPAASGIGGVAVGLLAGPIIERGGYLGLLTFSSGLIVAALVAASIALRRSHVR
jgi:hypothetical protein